MRRFKISLTLAATVLLAAANPAKADNGSYSGSGGVFSTGTAAGQGISVQGLALAGTTASLSFNCPITAYGAGTYQINWKCAGGSVTITSTDKSIRFKGTFLSGSMSYSGGGGGRGGHTTYWYEFYGALSGTVTAGGVTQAVYGSISHSVKTTSQVGSSGAPVTGLSLGWNSAYSPILVGDLDNGRILGADNIAGANLAAYGAYGSGAGEFESIAGLAEDAKGRIYATDSAVNRVVRIDDLTGRNWRELGSQGAGTNRFSQPQGVAIDSAGKIWVADAGNNRIVRFDDMTGKNWTAFGTLGTGANEFNAPSAITFDSSGGIYVADAGNNRIVRFEDFTGKNWTALSTINIDPYGYNITSPVGLAVRSSGQIVIALADGYLFSVSDMTGANGTASLWSPSISGIGMDEAGTLYVAGGFSPGLGQTVDGGAGYFGSALGISNLRVSAVAAARTSSPPPAAPALSTGALSFGSRNVGEAGAAQEVRISNLGAAALSFTSIQAGADYKLTDGCAVSLHGGGNCVVKIQFDPAATGNRTGTLSIESTSVHPLLSVELSGTGTAPQAVILPPTLTFLAQPDGTASGAQTVALSNTGTGPLTISSIAASGDFAETHNCPAVVGPGNGCTIQAVFKPSASGSRSGSLTISDDATPGGTQQTVALNGTGLSQPAAFTLTPESLMFPDQQIGVASGAQAMVLKNGSGATVWLGAPVYPGGFAGTSSCGVSLAAGASCAFHVQFVPAAAGPVSGTLTIPITGQPSLNAGLAGTGTPSSQPAALAISPQPVDFGALQVGDNPSLNVTIKNSLGLPTGIRSITLSGSAAFTITGNGCPAALAGGASCIVQITFQPTVAAIFSGTLKVRESSGARTDVPVSGSASASGGD